MGTKGTQLKLSLLLLGPHPTGPLLEATPLINFLCSSFFLFFPPFTNSNILELLLFIYSEDSFFLVYKGHAYFSCLRSSPLSAKTITFHGCPIDRHLPSFQAYAVKNSAALKNLIHNFTGKHCF